MSGLDMAWKETGPLVKSAIQAQITFCPLFYDFSLTKNELKNHTKGRAKKNREKVDIKLNHLP